MSDRLNEKPDEEGFDRRDFMIASVAAAGASAALAAGVGTTPADAQVGNQPPLSLRREPPIPAT